MNWPQGVLNGGSNDEIYIVGHEESDGEGPKAQGGPKIWVIPEKPLNKKMLKMSKTVLGHKSGPNVS